MKNLLSIILFFAAAGSSQAQYNIYTLAGTGASGGNEGLNGPATAAAFAFPSSVKVDKKGNVYIADWFNNMVKKVSPDGIITAFAGTGSGDFGDEGGLALNTAVPLPLSIFIDDTGHVYIAQFGDYTIRKVDTAGNITRFCGKFDPDTQYDGDDGDGGPALNARISAPAGMTMDKQGNFYFTQLDFKVRKVDTDGIITPVAGANYGYSGDGGFAEDAELNTPRDIAVDAAGNIYVADEGNNVIRRIRPSGIISTFAGIGTAGYSGDGGSPQDAQLNHPYGITIDSAGEFFIPDWGNNVIRKIAADGSTISTIAGTGGVAGYSGDGGDPLMATLNGPASVAVEGNYIYIAETGNNTVRYIGPPRVVLPLKLISFTGSMQGSNALLQWQTSNEINISRFELESSYDGVQFKKINSRYANNNTSTSSYNYTDLLLTGTTANTIYYRLKMVDKDGKISYSAILRLSLGQLKSSLRIFPNPVKNVLNIQADIITKGNYNVQVFDASGKEIIRKNYVLAEGSNLLPIPFNQVVKGIYWLSFKGPGYVSFHSRFVKE